MTDTELPFDPADVRRVEDATGSHIEPPLDPSWSTLARLAWSARVTEIDCGMPNGTLVVQRVSEDRYILRTPDRYAFPHQLARDLSYDLHLVAKGWRIARAVDAKAAAGG